MTKKGSKSWKPAHRLKVDKKEGWRYRMVDHTDHYNVEKKKAEGWEWVNATTGIPGKHDRPSGTADGSNTDTGFEYKELRLMAMPEDLAQERDAYYAEKTRQQTVGLKDRLTDEIAKSGVSPEEALSGKIVIE